MKKKISIIAVVFLILFYAQPVFAYQYWGPSSNPYRLKTAPNGKYWNPALNGVVINGQTYNFKTLYNNAMSDWNGGILNFTQGSANQGINMHHGDYGANQLYGWTEMYKSGGTRVQPCSTCAPTESWDYAKVFMNHYYIGLQKLTNQEVKGLATHEIGHALGLAHSNVSQSIMHLGWMNNRIYYVQSDDRNGINFLYRNRSLAQVKTSSSNENTEIIASVVPYETLEKLVNSSKLIVEVQVLEQPNTIEYENAIFTNNKVVVKDVIIGDDNLVGTTINLIELGDIYQGDIAVVQPGKRYLLFLQKYEGPVIDDAYVPLGLYQGKFELNDQNKLELNLKHIYNAYDTEYHRELTNMNLEQAKEKIKQVANLLR